MARALWKGSISFGLVNIPVALEIAVREKDVRFHQVHHADGGRIRERRFCEKDGKEVPYQQVAKGFELSKGNLIILTPEELRAADPAKDKTIPLEVFVGLQEVDPLYFQRSYYLSPDGKAAARPYRLFAEAMETRSQAAVGRIVLATKEHLCLLRSHQGVLVLTTMAFGDEVEEAPEVGGVETSARELQMAQALIDQMAGKFDPSKFHDQHRQRVLKLLEQKASGKQLELPAERPPPRVTDLVEALERSLAAGKARKPARAHPRRAGRNGKHRAAPER